MTRLELQEFLNRNFYKWTVREIIPLGIVVKVKGTISVATIGELDQVRHIGLVIHFYTMGFFESLFICNRNWTTEESK